MEQLTQNLKDGTMQLLEVPFPALPKGNVLVRNHYSVISTGTEGKTVKDARLSYIGKARARKEEVKKVIDAAKTFGVMNTYKMVMNKLDAPSSLGYSCAGEVIDVAYDVKDFKVGDFVACGGTGAIHAEVVAVPVNLCTKVDPSVDLKYACFATLGAIALQGIRQADLRLGENCVVIGLGLIGQLTAQMLAASGVKTIGIDVDSKAVDLAKKNGISFALERNRDDLEQVVQEYTDGYGTDAVIITAGTDSLDPVDLAGALSRKKGKVVIVGGVPTGFKRPNYFRKELDLRMSCSYGPGRYDLEYEEQGIDYPYAYVRWTENRNMQAFTELLKEKKLNIDTLLTHTFEFKEAPKAYQMILDKTEPFVGMVLKYDTSRKINSSVKIADKKYPAAEANIGLIGAGSFGQNFLLPAIKGNANLVGVSTARPNNARNIADKNGFAYATGKADELFNDKNINTIFIATRHDSHAEYVMQALNHHKNVFVEKPLCMTMDELETIKSLYAEGKSRVMVGFNRRFAPFIEKIKSTFHPDIPMAIHYRINAGIIPADHWIHNPEIGGGRIIGEVCHFIDLAMHLTGSRVKNVSALSLDDPSKLQDTTVINLSFQNGSIANISYFSNGNKNLDKEFLEVFSGGIVAVVDDFKTLNIYGKTTVKMTSAQDKGHKNEVLAYLNAVKKGQPAPIAFNEIYLSTFVTLKVLESIRLKGVMIDIE